MKKSILILLAILLTGALYIKADPFSPGRYRVFNDRHECVGYLRQNPLDENRIDIFDSDWRRKGRIEKNQDMWNLEKAD